MKYKLIDHTADLGIHVFGSDEKELFSNAAMAMFDVITDIEKLEGSRKHNVHVTGDDRPELMVNWLRELLYLWAGKEMLVKRVDIIAISENELSAIALVEAYDPERHVVKSEIKAVTYHQIIVERRSSGWEAKIIFDV